MSSQTISFRPRYAPEIERIDGKTTFAKVRQIMNKLKVEGAKEAFVKQYWKAAPLSEVDQVATTPVSEVVDKQEAFEGIGHNLERDFERYIVAKLQNPFIDCRNFTQDRLFVFIKQKAAVGHKHWCYIRPPILKLGRDFFREEYLERNFQQPVQFDSLRCDVWKLSFDTDGQVIIQIVHNFWRENTPKKRPFELQVIAIHIALEKIMDQYSAFAQISNVAMIHFYQPSLSGSHHLVGTHKVVSTAKDSATRREVEQTLFGIRPGEYRLKKLDMILPHLLGIPKLAITQVDPQHSLRDVTDLLDAARL